MPYARGTQIVPRDRSILTALAVARYLSAEQIARLAFAGRDESIVRRRLTRLGRRGAPDLDPLVRFIRYRHSSGSPERAWALTEAGHAIAQPLVPYASVARSDVGAAFIEHALVLNDVLIDLVLRTTGAQGTWHEELPFRWMSEGVNDLLFDYWDARPQAIGKGRIRPDATLEIGEPRRRIFVECETGSHSIVSSDPLNTGATWAKIQRYAQLIAGTSGQHDARTPYSILCPDGFTPGVLFLVQSERRRDGIRKLVSDPKRRVRITVRAYTLGEAAGVLGNLVNGHRESAAPSDGAVELTSAHLEILGTALSQCDGALAEARQAVERHNRSLQQPVRSVGPLRAPESPEALRQALALLALLRGGSARATATPAKDGAAHVSGLAGKASGAPAGR